MIADCYFQAGFLFFNLLVVRVIYHRLKRLKLQ